MDVLVPEGVGDKAGYIRIESEGADVEVKGIVMFYKQECSCRSSRMKS